MSNTFQSHFLIRLLLAMMLLGAFQTASASGQLARLDDFQQNCDINQLKLSPEQYRLLRQIRNESKQASDRAYLKADRAARNRRQTVMAILSKNNFDENAARDYVESRYLPSMDLAVQDFQVQHKFFQMLSPRQRQLWISRCM